MFKVWVKATGDRSYATNNLEFETVDKARKYGSDLFMRWMGAEKWAVLPKSAADVGEYLTPGFVDANKV